MKLRPMIVQIAVCAAMLMLVSCGSQETNGTVEQDTAFDLAVAQNGDGDMRGREFITLRIAGVGEDVEVTFQGKPFQYSDLKGTRKDPELRHLPWDLVVDKGVSFGTAEKYLLAFQSVNVNKIHLATRPDLLKKEYHPGFGLELNIPPLREEQIERLLEMYPDWKKESPPAKKEDEDPERPPMPDLPPPPPIQRIEFRSVYQKDSARSRYEGGMLVLSASVTAPGEITFDGKTMDFAALSDWILSETTQEEDLAFSFCAMPETDWETFIRLIDTLKELKVRKYEITTKFKTE